jgi:ABC-type Zn uptake system ZnuABC Zn-binding protein ZnuA
VIAVAGLNQEQDTAPKELAATIEAVRKSGVSAVFPEEGASKKSLESISKATGAKIASPLIADGNGHGDHAGFEGMIRQNVTSITQALAAQ